MLARIPEENWESLEVKLVKIDTKILGLNPAVAATIYY